MKLKGLVDWFIVIRPNSIYLMDGIKENEPIHVARSVLFIRLEQMDLAMIEFVFSKR